MSNYPNYLIEATDSRFSATMVDWLTNLAIAVQDTQCPNYFENIELQYINPHKNIAHDILKSLNYLKSSIITEQWLCYDANVYSYDDLALKLTNYRCKTKRRDVVLTLQTSFAITATMSEELIDYRIPFINIIAVNYTGPKAKLLHPISISSDDI
jgi:hypothetical protein